MERLRINRQWLRIQSSIAALAALGSIALADNMYAVDASSDRLYIFDSVTGETITALGLLDDDPGRYTTPVSMAVTADRSGIFIINNSPASDAGLSKLDPITGKASHIGGNVFSPIAFGPADRLYGIEGTNRLGVVSLDTGIIISLGGDVLPRLFGLDYNPADGLLYGITGAPSSATGPKLLKLDPANGTVVGSVQLTSPLIGSAPGSIAFEEGGTLVMTDLARVLWEVDITTGAMTMRASGLTHTPQGLGLAPCRPDLNGDGRLDIFDFLAFQNAFSSGDRRADFDGDGSLTIFDFLAFQNEFEHGC